MNNQGVISFENGSYVLLLRSDDGVQVYPLAEVFEIKLRGEWCRVRLQCGGYKGWYYVTAAGERGRLALCMEVRLCEQAQVEEAAVVPLDQMRAAWVGKAVESRVPLAGGLVRGVVREITQRGQVVFVYSPRLNGVPVVASFPVEQVGEVLALASVAA